MVAKRVSPLTFLAIVPIAVVAASSATAGPGSDDVASETLPDVVGGFVLDDDGVEDGAVDDAVPFAVGVDLACDTAPTLVAFIACVRAATPASNSELYTVPSIAESQDFAFVVAQMMDDMDDGLFDCDAIVPVGLDEHYSVSLLESNGREFCVFHEFLDADLDGFADLGWGTFLYAPDAHNEINLQAAHIRSDIYVEREAVDLFEISYSRSALIAGSHRLANSVPSVCQGFLSYFEADAAHNVGTLYAAGKAIAAHYGAQEVGGVIDFSSAHPDFHALQFHGMGVSGCGDDHVFMSNGDGSDVLDGDGAQRLATSLQLHQPEWNVRYRGDGNSTCNKYGSRNTLARYFNGIVDNGAEDLDNSICSHDGDHPAVSARFIHIEQKRCLSGASCQYGAPDAIRTAAYWSDAISETFDTPTCTDGLENGDELGVDCGGSCPACPTCFDGLQNGDELDIDCGGSCPACPTCTDGILNGDELGIDCGGYCPACPTCTDGLLNGDELGIDCGGSCPACPTCFDGILNGNELGVDCGGSCPACPTCTDGLLNGDELGIDCGGSCPTCPTCTDGILNGDELGIDCGGSCPACPTCSDGLQNGDELGVDCGGSCTACPTCSDGLLNGDELGIDCGGSCPACPTCTDGIQNGNELGIDCGGSCPACPTCTDGIENGDEFGIDCGGSCPACPTCFDGIQNGNEEGVDCGGYCPLSCGGGATCTDGIENGNEFGIDCGGSCPACPTCIDGIQNGNEEGVDCGGYCLPCPA